MVNLHYLHEKVCSFVGDGSQHGLRVYYSHEPELLGTAGAVKKVSDFFDSPFYVVYSDNFSQWDLRKLRLAYETRGSKAVVAVHWREDVTQSGMVEMDGDDRIVRFVEKPKPENVTSHYVSAGFYYLGPGILDYIPENAFSDFAFDVFPRALQAGEKIHAVKMDDPIIGIDTMESYNRANELAFKLLSKQTFSDLILKSTIFQTKLKKLNRRNKRD